MGTRLRNSVSCEGSLSLFILSVKCCIEEDYTPNGRTDEDEKYAVSENGIPEVSL